LEPFFGEIFFISFSCFLYVTTVLVFLVGGVFLVTGFLAAGFVGAAGAAEAAGAAGAAGSSGTTGAAIGYSKAGIGMAIMEVVVGKLYAGCEYVIGAEYVGIAYSIAGAATYDGDAAIVVTGVE